MSTIGTVLTVSLSLYALFAITFLISENRRPQATMAWMLVFFFAPGIGVLIYGLFGRSKKGFARQGELLRQDLKVQSSPILAPILSRQESESAKLEGQSVIRKKLMMLVRQNSQSALTAGNQAEILQDASEFYPALIEDLKSAQHSVHLQYFIWGADSFTERLKSILIAKANDGVEVRLLYDPLGSHAHLTSAYVRDLKAAGVQIVPTAPLYRLHTISYRNHRKITVIDGAIGYTGGMNIGREHLSGGKGFSSWRDTQLRVVGEAAVILQAVFATDWYNATRENLFVPEHFPSLPRGSVKSDVAVQILTSGPDSQWAGIRQLYFFMIVSAQRHVLIQSPYFVLDASIAEALKSAAMSGVDVKVMLSARASGNRLPEWAGNTFIMDVVSAGVRVFLYQKGYLHAKTISIDSEICSIGSANIDIRSFSINYELNAVLYSKKHATQLEQDFERDLSHCIEFNADAYRNSNPVLRFRDSVARLLSPLL